MKKSLLVAALITGFAGAAQAETSVTLYGILDGGINYQQFKGTDAAGNSFKATNTGFANGVQSGNRWGLKGSEDLGDGLKAIFVLEGGFNLGTGAQGSSGRIFDRQSTVGLQSDAWGKLELGRQTNIASKYFAGVASPFGYAWGQASVGSAFSSANSVRYDNMIMYQTPNFSGFQFGLGYAFTANGSQQFKVSGNEEPNTRAWTTGLRYANGPIAVALTYDQFKMAETGTNVNGDPGVTGKAWNIGGSYDFEVAKLHLGFGQTRDGWFKSVSALGAYDYNANHGLNRASSSVDAIEGLKVNSYSVGVSAPIGANGKILAAWNMADPRHDASVAGTEKQQVYSLGYTYALSKRTNVYALGSYAKHVYFNDDLKATQFAVGLRHRF